MLRGIIPVRTHRGTYKDVVAQIKRKLVRPSENLGSESGSLADCLGSYGTEKSDTH